MGKGLLSSRPFVQAGSFLADGYIRLVRATSTKVREPEDTRGKLLSNHPQIVAMWHGQFLLLAQFKPKEMESRAMVARHGDAELLGATLRRQDTELIRGAGAGARKRDRGGASAFRGALRALGEGCSIVMTADVPPGPARRAGEGIVNLAQKSGRPMVPCAVASSSFIAMKSWSRFTVNLPFSRLGVFVGEPIYVPEDADAATVEAYRRQIEQKLNEATARAYAMAEAVDPLSPEALAAAEQPGAMLGFYRLLTGLAAPLATLILAWRTRRGKEEPERRPERFGIASAPRPAGFLAWFHAASVGEVNAVLPVIDAIAASHPDVRVLLTTGTVTSARLARARLPQAAIHQYVPLDNHGYVQRFLDHWRPDLGVFVESEIWPNLILEAKTRKVPLVLVNGRMSKRSFRRFRKRPRFARPLFSAFSLVLAQNDTLAERFAQLGAGESIAIGNLKADAPPPPADMPGQKRLKAALGGRTLLLAASTHPGEDEIVAAAHTAMKVQRPNLLTIIVPRHPDRGPVIAEMLRMQDLGVTLRSEGAMPDAATDIYIADTIGELGFFYTLAPVAFIGGSLVPHGGQNPLEPIKLHAAVITGRHWSNFRDTYAELLRVEGAKEVTDADSLAAAALTLLADAAAREAMASRAELAIEGMSGALARTLTELERFLPPKPSLQHAS